ncbi:hypothetical protein JDW15_06140 [Aerococcaceae bacterium zg-ZJ1578]|uniref:hypothetical protein n=1 Tax=Aerococcaceae bacterium zg-252 TaxID=2796928 RepID=UPI001A1B69D1|nr:hypothetical protein [Aerococcaceae bacterium zg-1578]
MKETFIVFRDRSGKMFLAEYQNNNGTLVSYGKWVNSIGCALKLPLKDYEPNREHYESLAKAFGSEIVKVEAEYTVSEINASEVRSITIDVNKISGIKSGISSKTITNPMVDELECRVATLEAKLDKTIENIRDMLHLHFSKNGK